MNCKIPNHHHSIDLLKHVQKLARMRNTVGTILECFEVKRFKVLPSFLNKFFFLEHPSRKTK